MSNYRDSKIFTIAQHYLTDTSLYNRQLIKPQMQLPIPVCIKAPSIADTSLFHKPDTAQFPDMASTTVQHLANRGHK